MEEVSRSAGEFSKACLASRVRYLFLLGTIASSHLPQSFEARFIACYWPNNFAILGLSVGEKLVGLLDFAL